MSVLELEAVLTTAVTQKRTVEPPSAGLARRSTRSR
jgi:hypothetical protein